MFVGHLVWANHCANCFAGLVSLASHHKRENWVLFCILTLKIRKVWLRETKRFAYIPELASGRFGSNQALPFK